MTRTYSLSGIPAAPCGPRWRVRYGNLFNCSRHCERSEAIQVSNTKGWIASPFGLAMTL
jgi:hypothetical protein